MVKKILAAVGFLAAVFLVVVAMQPDQFTIERSTSIAAPPAVPFAAVNDLRRWRQWSPWENRDPNLQREYSGPESGVGASYHWSGDETVGEGRMTITESEADRRIGIALEFVRPFAATNQVTFRFDPHDTGSRVTWTMQGVNTFMGKAMSLLMNMDAMVGGDFEAGLAKLKEVAESGA